jgi:hypothetical protein
MVILRIFTWDYGIVGEVLDGEFGKVRNGIILMEVPILFLWNFRSTLFN